MSAVTFASFVSAFVASTQALSTQASRPHIVLIVADDLGWNDVGFRNNQTIETPTIDALASAGHVLSNYYVQASCSPPRACLLTGRLPSHTGIGSPTKSKVPVGLSLREVTVAQALRSEGYRAHAVGKWHVGMMSFNHTPTFRGFESFYGCYGGSEDYYTHAAGHGAREVLDFRRDASEFCGRGCSEIAVGDVGQYSTDLFTAEAVRLISDHDVSAPLFLYLAYQAVHGPIDTPPRAGERYAGKFTHYLKRRKFAAVVTAFDEGVGSVVAALHARGMYEETLIVVTTDNGGSLAHGSSNWPLRAGKGTIWEGGLRGTALVRGPGLRNDGSELAGLAHAVDWLPTFVRLAGGAAGENVDGVDLWPRLTGGEGAPGRNAIYLGVALYGKGASGQRMRGIRQGGLKLVVRTQPEDGDDPERQPTRVERRARKRAQRAGASLTAVGRQWASEAGLHRKAGFLLGPVFATTAPELEVELYDLETDLHEENNIAAARPEDVHALLGLMASMRVDEVVLDVETILCKRAVHRVRLEMPGGKVLKAIEPACDLHSVPPGAAVLMRKDI